MVTVKCQACGKKFGAARSSRKFCSDKCRKRGYRKTKKAVAVAAAVAESVAPAVADDDDLDEAAKVAPISLATLAELEECGRVWTPLGQIALRLAHRLDTFSLLENGSGMAALAKELHATLEAATQNPETPDDPVEVSRAAVEKQRRGGS